MFQKKTKTRYIKALFIFLLLFNLIASYRPHTTYKQTSLESTSVSVLYKNNNLQLMAVSGQKSWGNFATDVTIELASYIPAGKYQKVYNRIYLVLTKGWQAFTNDWMGLAWTVVDAVTALIPGALPAQIFFSIAKLTPSF